MFRLIFTLPFIILDIIIWILIIVFSLLLWINADDLFYQVYGKDIKGRIFFLTLAGRFLHYEKE